MNIKIRDKNLCYDKVPLCVRKYFPHMNDSVYLARGRLSSCVWRMLWMGCYYYVLCWMRRVWGKQKKIIIIILQQALQRELNTFISHEYVAHSIIIFLYFFFGLTHSHSLFFVFLACIGHKANQERMSVRERMLLSQA